MRIVALGGAGAMGRYAVRAAVAYDFVDEVIVADLDADAAARFASSCVPKVRAVAADVRDEAALTGLLREADAVLNTVGPFYRFGVPVLRCAIEASCHYLDINDDWEPTLEMLELDQTARDAGVTAIIGMGASPGVSNLLAVKAMGELDTVEEVVTGWGLEGAETEDATGTAGTSQKPSAALVHWMHQCSGLIRIWRDGRFVDARPIEEVAIDYPGIGHGSAWTVGHPEAVTLPRSRAEMRRSHNVMVAPRWLIEIVRSIAVEIDEGRLTTEQAAGLLMQPPPRESRVQSGASAETGARLPPLFAFAQGTRSGRPARAGALVLGMPAGGMGGATGVPLAVGLALLAQGKLAGPGVFAPEAIIDPGAFFDALAPLCGSPFESGPAMVQVSTATD